MTIKKNLNVNIIRKIAVVVLIIGAIISAILTIGAGHKNTSILLPALFLIWVLSPFFALITAIYKFRHHPDSGSITSYLVMIFIAIGSLIGYTGILSPVGVKPAAIFLIVPLISWLLITTGFAVEKIRGGNSRIK